MKSGTLIPFDRSHRLLDKVEGYIADINTFFVDTNNGVATLLEALPYAGTSLLVKILPLLGYAGQDKVLWPLYDLMVNESTDEQIRATAAIQLGLAASQSTDPSALNTALVKMLDHSAPMIRIGCALALGWEGNYAAVQALIQHLNDPDQDVQTSLVAALVSVGDDYVFDFLKSRLQIGSKEEKRSILLNFWRFAEKYPSAESVYCDVMMDLSADLRVDGLVGMGMLPLSLSIIDSYKDLLNDNDAHVRYQVLDNLLAYQNDELYRLRNALHPLLNDEDSRVRQAAIRVFKKCRCSESGQGSIR